MSVTIVNIGGYVPAMPMCEVREQLCGVVWSLLPWESGSCGGIQAWCQHLYPPSHLTDAQPPSQRRGLYQGGCGKIVTYQVRDINFLSWDPYQNPKEKV